MLNAILITIHKGVRTIDLFHNDVKRSFQDDTRNLIGSAIMYKSFSRIAKTKIAARISEILLQKEKI